MQLYPELRRLLDAMIEPTEIAQLHCAGCQRINTWTKDDSAGIGLVDGCACDDEGLLQRVSEVGRWETYTPGRAMHCEKCANQLSNDGSCPQCGPQIVGPSKSYHFKCKCGADLGSREHPVEYRAKATIQGTCSKCGAPYKKSSG